VIGGLLFEDLAPPAASAPNRADIACFVGFVARRDGPLPPEIERWLAEHGWIGGPHARAGAARLDDVPVPIETWETFDQLFTWDARPVSANEPRTATTYLGAAVRSYFAQGGRKCYVVRAGDPWPLDEGRAERMDHIDRMVPGWRSVFESAAVDPTTWHGVGHLYGLPDVSFVCLPDLADAVATDPAPPDPPPELALPDERFVECSAPTPPEPEDRQIRFLPAPRCDLAAYREWAAAVAAVGTALQRGVREVQLIAALPLPEDGSPESADLMRALAPELLARPLGSSASALGSGFVQLAWPWVKTPGSRDLPGGLESPCGALAGVLARNALTRGAFRSAAGLPLGDVHDVWPLLRQSDLRRAPGAPPGSALAERVSLLGGTPGGMRVLSDVTAALDPVYRPAGVHRLISVVVRAARRMGEGLTFEPSGERLWARVRERLTDLLTELLRAGALRGSTPAEAFSVRCDRTTMTQNDLDNGRLVAEVRLAAAAPIDTITVVLAMEEGGAVSLLSSGTAREAA
jgi:hypothetical protein